MAPLFLQPSVALPLYGKMVSVLNQLTARNEKPIAYI